MRIKTGSAITGAASMSRACSRLGMKKLLSLSEKLIQRTARSATTSKHKNSNFFAAARQRRNTTTELSPVHLVLHLRVQIDIAAPIVQSNVEIRNN